MKKVTLLTSGGDAPGMNAAIRAVVRTGLNYGWDIFGIRQGYSGLIQNHFVPLGARDVGGIIQQGGTILGTSRCPEFKTKQGQNQALENLKKHRMDALIVIGGNGSQAGAHALWKSGFPVIGIASTIDNDLPGSDMAIGIDTALNIALESIDRLKVTASSHQRAFLVEVMGRDSGYLALMAGIAGGAEAIILPEVETDPFWVAEKFRSAYERGKTHTLAVVAEGARWNAQALAHFFEENHEKLGFDLRVTVLGHVQRGGTPGAFDRLLATQLAAAATESLSKKKFGFLMGWSGGESKAIALNEVVTQKKPLDLGLLKLTDILAK